jgi:murein DD-endopeptidase MepM/ murein hydrolase activator NlpD
VRVALLLTLAPAFPAGAFELAFPVACVLGDSCHIQNTFDHDAGPDATDTTCGSLAYDGHDGTDIALPTLAEMVQGVDVLAAAPGTVTGARDGMPDILISDPAARALNGRDCGNGVVIDHGDGWETQYCHMMKDSVAVSNGQIVNAGTPLGQIGLSGNTEFQHLHLSVRRNGVEVDPFAPNATGCGALPNDDLWLDAVTLTPGGILDMGISTAVPNYAAIKAGLPDPDALPDTAQALVVWAYTFGTKAGDAIALSLSGPDGVVIADAIPLDRTQAQSFRAIGRKLRDVWPHGTYRGSAILTRNGETVDQSEVTLAITP